MPPTRREFLHTSALAAAGLWLPKMPLGVPHAGSSVDFQPTFTSLSQYQAPDVRPRTGRLVCTPDRKDLIGGWAKATRRAGTRFGVSVHAAHAWSWYEVSQGADTAGPLAGAPYDGTLTRAQGKGTWWDGFDPQDLYKQRHTPGQGLVWEGGKLTIKSLSKGASYAPGQVERVELVGAPGALAHTRTTQGLEITLPQRRVGDYVYTFEISGQGLMRG